MTPEVLDIARSLMASLDCPRSLTVDILIRNGEWLQLVQLTTNPLDYDDSERYLRAAQATDFLRKYPNLPLDIDTMAEAKRRWFEAEHSCFLTNRRLYEIMDFGTLNGRPVCDPLLAVVASVRRNVRHLIGGGPPAALEPRFGPGATVSDRSGRTTVPDKITSVPTYTPGAAPLLVDWSFTAWYRAVRHLGNGRVRVRGNSYFTVPKDALKDRSCGKEPSLNVAFQLAASQPMRQRLKRAGYDLDVLQDRHRLLARRFSLDNSHVTIDLSNASDTVASSLVKMMLPPSWYAILESLRSPFTKVDGKWHKLEKFSSMGNGFTFELETVIFLAICQSLCGDLADDEVVSVYGDDIIVPSRCSKDVIAGLGFFGFTVNSRKTFTSTEFRESCGGDYFRGDGVRPYLLEYDPHEPQDFIALANGIRRMAQQFPKTLWPSVRRTWFRILDRIPNHVRSCRGPEALGDLVVHDGPETWRTRWRSSIRYVRVYRPATFKYVRWEGFAYEVQYAAALYGVTLSGPNSHRGWGSFLVPRDGVEGYKVGWVPFS